jgi:hypothetical protein
MMDISEIDSSTRAYIIRAWIVERVTLSIDNDDATQNEATERACRAVIEDMGSTRPSLYDYREMHAGRADRDRYVYADVIGDRISDLIGEWIETEKETGGSEFLMTMVADVFDLNDRSQKRLFGEHYMPTPDDLEQWARDNDIDDLAEWLREAEEDDNR